MVKRKASWKDEEPDQKSFNNPSEKEHLFQCIDVWEDKIDPDVFTVKLEVVGGDEAGRTLLNRLNIDDKFKGFFATRLFLKAIGEPYKGDNFTINTDDWIGKQCYATVVHNGKYANIKEYNFDKKIEQVNVARGTLGVLKEKDDTIAWDDDLK